MLFLERVANLSRIGYSCSHNSLPYHSGYWLVWKCVLDYTVSTSSKKRSLRQMSDLNPGVQWLPWPVNSISIII